MLTFYGGIICDWCWRPMIKHVLDELDWEDEEGESHGWHWKGARDCVCNQCADKYLLSICRNECRSYGTGPEPCNVGVENCWHHPPWAYETYFSDRVPLTRRETEIYKQASLSDITIIQLIWDPLGYYEKGSKRKGGWMLESRKGKIWTARSAQVLIELLEGDQNGRNRE